MINKTENDNHVKQKPMFAFKFSSSGLSVYSYKFNYGIL
jgi:hypothetical protein